MEAGTSATRIDYQGAGPAFTAIRGGVIDFFFGTVQNFNDPGLPSIAISSPKRIPAAPHVPTLAESGYPTAGIAFSWGVAAPRDIPQEVVAILERALIEMGKEKEVTDKIARLGLEPVYQGSAEMATLMKNDYQYWKEIADRLNIKVE